MKFELVVIHEDATEQEKESLTDRLYSVLGDQLESVAFEPKGFEEIFPGTKDGLNKISIGSESDTSN